MGCNIEDLSVVRSRGRGNSAIKGLWLFALACLVCLGWSVPSLNAEENAQEPSAESETKSDAIPKPTAKTVKKREMGPLTAGLVFGTLISADDDGFELIVEGLPPTPGRKKFYMDRASRVFLEKKRRGKFSEIPIGSRVAVRYFAEGNIAIVKHLFLVIGEFKPRDYIVQSAQPKAPKKEEAKGGGH